VSQTSSFQVWCAATALGSHDQGDGFLCPVNNNFCNSGGMFVHITGAVYLIRIFTLYILLPFVCFYLMYIFPRLRGGALVCICTWVFGYGCIACNIPVLLCVSEDYFYYCS